MFEALNEKGRHSQRAVCAHSSAPAQCLGSDVKTDAEDQCVARLTLKTAVEETNPSALAAVPAALGTRTAPESAVI
jgi:hypothetical protein